MKYQRVLYTNKLTTELKSRLRISSYDKRRSLKGNVYYVSFESDADIEHADRISKRLRNITLKPFQPRCASEAQRESRTKTCNHQDNLPAPSISLSSSSSSSSSPSSVPSIPTLQTSNSVSFSSDANLIEICLPSNTKIKEQLINDVQLCLNAVEAARLAADKLYQLYKCGNDYYEALNHLFKLHSAAFYLKVTTSAQIKAAFCNGLRLPWSAIENSINVLKTDIRHEQAFMTKVASDKNILSKIDSTTSIVMSSKLVYQLTKLSD